MMRAAAAKGLQRPPRAKGAPAYVTVPSVANTVPHLHSKICACGGSCPRCRNELAVQMKLTSSQPGDQYEHEADQVADQVVRMSIPATGRPIVQRPYPEHEEEELLQTKEAAAPSPIVTPNVASEIPSIQGGGQPLPTSDRAFFEPRFGHERINTPDTAGKPVIQTQANPAETAPVTRCGESESCAMSGSLVQQAKMKTIGACWGRLAATRLIEEPDHPAWNNLVAPAVGQKHSSTANSHILEQAMLGRVVGEPDPSELQSTLGETVCSVPNGLSYISLKHAGCTAPCTLLHESIHFADITPCCVKAGMAYREASDALLKRIIQQQWNAYIYTDRDWFECRAYTGSETCLRMMNLGLLCDAPESVISAILIGAGTVAGGAVGGSIEGIIASLLGIGSGAATGPLAPVAVPSGATAGFISGAASGMIAGGMLGGLLGFAAEEMRRECCKAIKEERDSDVNQKNKHCGAGRAKPTCPW